MAIRGWRGSRVECFLIAGDLGKQGPPAGGRIEDLSPRICHCAASWSSLASGKLSWDDAYKRGFGGDSGAHFYFVGMEMARALVAAHGPGYLRHSFTRPVGAVFRNYIMLTLTDPRVITFAPELPGCSKTYRPSGSGAFQESRPPRRIPAIRRPCYPPVLLTGLPRRHCLLHGMNERPVPGNRKRGVKVCSWVVAAVFKQLVQR